MKPYESDTKNINFDPFTSMLKSKSCNKACNTINGALIISKVKSSTSRVKIPTQECSNAKTRGRFLGFLEDMESAKAKRQCGDSMWGLLHEYLQARIIAFLPPIRLLELQFRYPRWWHEIVTCLKHEHCIASNAAAPVVLRLGGGSMLWVHSGRHLGAGSGWFKFVPEFVRKLNLQLLRMASACGLMCCIAEGEGTFRLFVFNILSGCFKELPFDGSQVLHLTMSYDEALWLYRIVLVCSNSIRIYDSSKGAWTSHKHSIHQPSNCAIVGEFIYVTYECFGVFQANRYDCSTEEMSHFKLPLIQRNINNQNEMHLMSCKDRLLAVYCYVRSKNKSCWQLELRMVIWEFNNSDGVWRQLTRMPFKVQQYFNDSLKINHVGFCYTTCAIAGDCIYFSGSMETRFMPGVCYDLTSGQWWRFSKGQPLGTRSCASPLILLENASVDRQVF